MSTDYTLTPHNTDAAGPRDQLGRGLRDLRISVIDRCNFRCPYCMPESQYGEDYEFLRREHRLSNEEIVRVARIAVGLGVTKLRLTGGEPLLVKRLPELVAGLAAIGGVEDLALTTNGMLLADAAPALKAAGLHRLTLSLDSIDDDVFARLSGGRGDLARVLDGLRAAEAAGFDAIKINTVVQRGVNDDGVLDVLEHFRGTGHVVRMIEYMDVGNRNGWRRDEVVPSRELLERIAERWPVSPVAENYPGEVARRYRYDDGAGEIGFISSVTMPFCGGCHRARLAADGTLYTCLFATQGTRLLEPIRQGATDAELESIVRRVWLARDDRYSERRAAERRAARPRKVEMYRVGG
ncbi:MAG: GTP 3',8-cyclase MoaA [Pseudomonadota bacterium]